ncbi:MAG: glycosyltransferase family 2 protein [Lachnospiraceae bacterium]|nr:glycosyltransferase family 2 protein [Lachnospiraceae bacterium]
MGKENDPDHYRDLYEKEVKKNEKLIEEMADLEAEYAELKRKTDLLKNSFLFRVSKPLRNAWARFKHTCIRVKRYGSIKEIIRKLRSKRIERSAYRLHGTESFPSEEDIQKARNRKFSKDHVFSILVPLYNTDERFLRQFIESVTGQVYEGWQLCLADGSDRDHAAVGEIVGEYIKKDGRGRIRYKKLDKNEGISKNTNACFDLADGDFYALMDHDDILHPNALYEFMCLLEKKDAWYIYSDEATFKGNSIDNMITLHFKPDFAPDNLRANNYICHFSAFRRELIDIVGRFRSECDGSQDHDLILRLTGEAVHHGDGVCHVPKILYYWRSHAGSTAADINAKSYAIAAAKRAVSSYLGSLGFKDFEIESTRAFATIFRIRYALLDKPLVSIIIPNCDHADDLERCVSSITERTSYDNYEIVIVENNSTSEEIRDYYAKLNERDDITIADCGKREGFNFSKLVNTGADVAKGEYLILLNNDTQVITRNWIEELLMYALRPDVGAVGCKLYYGDYTIQHAGIVLGLGAHRTAGHTHYRLAKENLGYMGRLCYAQDVSAVTGACMMVSKTDFKEAGGFDEEFAVALNDVDFCLKLRQKGLLNIFTPFAELFHYESASRGSDVEKPDEKKAERYNREAGCFREKWKDVLSAGDPYYNPNFSLDHSNYTLKVSPAPMVE